MKHFLLSDCLFLNRTGDESLQRQLHRQLRGLIEQRVLIPGSKLPSSRSLAADLGTARNTVVAAYEQLSAEGYISVRHGARAEILPVPHPSQRRPQRTALPPLSQRGQAIQAQSATSVGDRSVQPADVLDTRDFPFGVWSRVVARRALQYRATEGHAGTVGDRALREAIAGYVGVARGVHCDPEQVVVTTCTQAARDLLARLLLDPGDVAWIEEPGYAGAQDAFLAAGAKLRPLRVEGQEWLLDPPGERPRVIYVSPSNQRPLGPTMRREQRRQLLEHAAHLGAFVIEDDFDGDYNFSGHPVPTLYSADASGRVIYLGNFDRLLFPAMRIGFVVLSDALVGAFQRYLGVTGQRPSSLLQAALADFIEGGHMARHLKKVRAAYVQRREMFREQCEVRLSRWLTLTRGEVGLSCVGLMPHDLNDVAIAEDMCRQGLCVSPLSTHYRFGSPLAGLVISLGPLSKADIPLAIHRLEEAFRRATGDDR